MFHVLKITSSPGKAKFQLPCILKITSFLASGKATFHVAAAVVELVVLVLEAEPAVVRVAVYK